MMSERLYHYRAVITHVYDGDSVTADIDLGLGVWLRGQKLRLYGIDTPELRGDERGLGLLARDWLRAELRGSLVTDKPLSAPVIIETHKDKTGKYGRWLAIIWLETDGGWMNMNDALIDAGHAEPYLR